MKGTVFSSLLIAIPVVALVVSTTVESAQLSSVSACKLIKWEPYQVYTLNASLHQRTHIILPEPIQGKPVSGNTQLWDVQGESVHLFVKPKNLANKEGKRITVAAVSTSNTSYDFVFTRVDKGADTCVRIVASEDISNEKQGWKTSVERKNEILSMQVNQLRKNSELSKKVMTKSIDNKVSDSIQKYKSSIYTRYSWNKSGGFIGEDAVTDVWDDGRFTYIRLKGANKGLLQVIAKINGKEEMVDYKFDNTSNLYTVSGLFPEFDLRYDNRTMTIKRKDNKTL